MSGTMHDPGLHDPFPDQLNAARFRAERDAARQELARLRDEVEAMRPRLMPEDMEWPRYTSGELVEVGDDVVGPDYGERIHVDAVKFHANGFTLCDKNGFEMWYESDERFERPVLDAITACERGTRALAAIHGLEVVRLELAPMRDDARETDGDARGGLQGASRSVGTGKASK